jgi:hypothetical protein
MPLKTPRLRATTWPPALRQTPDARSALVHFMRSLALPQPVCGTTTGNTVTLNPEQVTCARCVKKLPLAAFPEKELLARVRYLARVAGWLVYHTFNSRKSEAGFPDLVLVKPPRLVIAELKRAGEQPTIEQEAWLAALALVPGVECYLWRPADLPRIVEVLTVTPDRQRP